MPGTRHLIDARLFALFTVLAFLIASLGTGCASARVAVDEPEDIALYASWAWLPRAARSVEVSEGSAEALEADLARLIEARLLERGFRLTDDTPDFYVTYQVAVHHHLVEVQEPRAIYELSSHHSSPSFVIQSHDTAIHRYASTQLMILAVRRGGVPVWRARFSQNERQQDALSLEDAAAMLLERLPRHDARAAAAVPPEGCPPGAPEPQHGEGPAPAELRELDSPPPAACPRDAPAPRRREVDPPPRPSLPS